jgi:hypothetical protein
MLALAEENNISKNNNQYKIKRKRNANIQQQPKSGGSVVKSSVVLLFKFSSG